MKTSFTLLAIIVAGLGNLAGGTGAAAAPAKGATVLVLGDSLTAEAHLSGESTTRLADYRVDWSGSLFGSAPCNGLATARSTRYRPDVVVVAYSGNAGSMVKNCMNNESGAALTRRYVTDVEAIIDRFAHSRTRVVIVGAPVRMDRRADADAIFRALRSLAARSGVAFVDGGRTITPGRTFRASGRCLPGEARCGNARPGANVLRSGDRVHFCPTGPDFFGNCSTYSSGAVRYTEALGAGIRASKAPA